MPCIIKKCKCSQGGHIWESYCGKVLYMQNRPYKSVSEYIKYFLGKPVCKSCSRLSGLPRAIEKSKRTDERSKI